ncbi:hypothetical protein JCM10207_008184 [Rhodosporidiobolus poonsookiae]
MAPPPTTPLQPFELLLSSSSTHLTNLALTPDGLSIVKHKNGSLHSNKLDKPPLSTSTLLVPFAALLSASLTAPPTPSTARPLPPTLSIAALVPSRQGDPNSATKLWTLTGTVLAVGGASDGAGPSARESAADASKRLRAEEWCAEAEKRAYCGVKRKRRLHVIVNPAGGQGKAKKTWEEAVRPVLQAAGAEIEVSYTGPPGSPSHALPLAQRHPYSGAGSFDALVALSGDGILHELLNGLATHTSGQGLDALRKTPVVHVACGSGNAFATSLYGPERVGDARWAALVALKGQPLPFDMCTLTQASSPPLYSFLTQAFGLMADLDLNTEHLRFLGDLRFTLGYIHGALSRVRYPCRLSVLVPPSKSAAQGALTKRGLAERHNAALDAAEASSASSPSSPRTAPPLSPTREDHAGALPSPRYGTPTTPLPDGPRWDRLPTQAELARLEDVVGSEGEDGGEWLHFDLDGGGKDGGAFFVYGGKVPFIAKDVLLFPLADPADGLLDLVVVQPMGPLEALTAMDGAEHGALLSHRRVLYLKTPCYRLSFPPPSKGKKEGNLSIDGERVPYEPFQIEVVQGAGRTLSLTGRWEGRRRVEGGKLEG